MCRNIKTLFNFDPPATDAEIHDASLQFVRKLSGFTKPSLANEAAFDKAVEEVAMIAKKLIQLVKKKSRSKNSKRVAAMKRAQAIKRFGTKEIANVTN